MDYMKGLTIIIPCYNSEKTIVRCLDSLPEKKDLKVIIVDDYSTDKSVSIIRKYISDSAKDIKLVENGVNLGPGRTRNNGISLVETEYLSFLDSDDEYSPEYYDSVFPLIDGSIDMVVFDAMRVFPNGKYCMSMFFSDSINEGKISQSDALVYIKGCTCGKVYRTQIIHENKVEFGIIPRNEDMIFTKTAASFCHEIFYIRKPLYYYNDNEQSLMNNKNLLTINNAIAAFNAIKERIDPEKFSLELNSLYFIEVLYSTTTTLVMQGKEIKEIKKHYAACRSNYNKKDKYRCRYNKIYRISFVLMELGLFRLYRTLRKQFGR